MSEFEKPFLKKSDQKNEKKISFKRPHVNKRPLVRKRNLVRTKNWALNELWTDWENHLEKISYPEIEKTVKIKVKLPHVNKNH